MLNGRYISSKEVLRQVYRDNLYTYELPWQDSQEWILDAVRLIGAPLAMHQDQACITICNFRGMLPCDLDSIEQAAGSYGGCLPFALRSTTNTFHAVKSNNKPIPIYKELVSEANITGIIEQPIGQDISGNPVFELRNQDIIFPSITTDFSNTILAFDPTYSVNDNYIFTNFENGFVFLAYRALPIDKEGFPLVPDNQRYIEAIKAYIKFKIDYILYRSKELDKNIYEESEKQWLWYVGSAGNIARSPSYDQMESLLQAMKLVVNRNAHDKLFRTI